MIQPDGIQSLPFDEPVDERRNGFHINYVKPELLTDRLTSQSYRPEIVTAIADLRHRHKCVCLSRCARTRIRQGITPEYGTDGPKCLKLKQVRHVLVNSDAESRVSAVFASQHSDKVVSSDALFINRSGGFTVGRAGAYLRSEPVFVSDDVFALLPKDNFDVAYLACYLNSWWGKRHLECGITGSTGQLKLPQGHVENLPIPNLSLPLQKALGAKVRKADRLRQLGTIARNQSLQLLHEHLPLPAQQSERLHNYVDSSHLSASRLDAKHYAERFLQARRIAIESSGGSTLQDDVVNVSNGAEYRSFVDQGRPYLCVGDVQDCDLDVAAAVRIPTSVSVPMKSLIHPGDVLVVRTGSLGQAVEVLDEDCIEEPAISSHFVRLQLKDKERAGFIAAYLSFGCGQLLQWQIAYGAVQLQVSQDELLELPLPRIGAEVERRISDGIRTWRRYRRQIGALLQQSTEEMHAFLDGKATESAVLAIGEETLSWLATNHVPSQMGH